MKNNQSNVKIAPIEQDRIALMQKMESKDFSHQKNVKEVKKYALVENSVIGKYLIDLYEGNYV